MNYKTWGNNELYYWNNGNPNGMICDEKLWQPPSNCRPVALDLHDENIPNEFLMGSLPPCTSDRTACFNQDANWCDPSGWECGNTEGLFNEIIESTSEDKLHGCDQDEIYVHGVCMTQEEKERAESVGEKENEN
jgi:hypothetical protein